MSQKEQLLRLFRENHGVMTLGEILRSSVGYEWRARATELRRLGFTIELIEQHRDVPSANVYQLSEPVKLEPKTQTEKDAQMSFA